MSNNLTTCNLTSGFIDLATYDELEKYMYGGPEATAYFVRETRKATWFTQCPVTLARCNGTVQFGQECAWSISRAGDYLLGTWLHVVTPEVSLKESAQKEGICIAWTPNFMHALVKECCISFNDLVAARFDGTHLDFWAAFTTPASKSEGYKKMIGTQLPSYGSHIPSYNLNLPLPFFYTRDSGVALPTAALPYNEMRINFEFRAWQEMLLTFRETGNCPQDRTGHYSSPNFCKRNCPVVSVASDQLTMGGILKSAGHQYVGLDAENLITMTGDTAIEVDVNKKLADGTTLSTNLYDYNSVKFNGNSINSGDVSITFERINPDNNTKTPISSATLNTLTSTPGIVIVTYRDNRSPTSARNTNAMAMRVINVVSDINTHSTIGLLNNRYSHLNYDADVCDKCLLMTGKDTGPFSSSILIKPPVLNANNVQVWANYAIVSNEERKRMACAPRDMLIEQIQTSPSSNFGGQSPFPGTNTNSSSTVQSFDIRFSHAVKVIFFGAKNTTFKTVHSNYSTGVPCLSKESCNGCLSVQALSGSGYGGRDGNKLLYALGLSSAAHTETAGVSTSNIGESSLCDIIKVNTNVVGCCNSSDPISTSSIIYENTPRICLMTSDYYNQVQPYYHAISIPSSETSPVFCPDGLHMYSYSLDFMSLDPLGSTNYGKLTNVSINATASRDWGLGACVSNSSLQVMYDKNGNTLPSNYQQMFTNLPSNLTETEDILLAGYKGNHTVKGGLELIDSIKNTQKFSFKFVCSAVSNNIVRVSGGALGFPVL